LKLLITGASGLFGSKLAETALTKNIEVYAGHNKNPILCGIPVLFDVLDKNQVKNAFESVRPDVVVHAASLTNVDTCELDRELAWKINVKGAATVAAFAAKAGCFLVYVSTDYVFNGKKGYYKEKDQTEPLNYYGLTKFEAEKISLQHVSNCCIARTSVVYGGASATGKINFALWLLKKLKNGEKIQVVTDQYNSPTLNTSLVDMILDVIKQRLGGVFHLCGASRVSRYEFALAVAKIFDLDSDLIEPVLASNFNWSAPRPMDSSLDVSKAQQLLHVQPLELASALAVLKNEIANV
jgi:dTDP-4-dehydrorhamnose reductase